MAFAVALLCSCVDRTSVDPTSAVNLYHEKAAQAFSQSNYREAIINYQQGISVLAGHDQVPVEIRLALLQGLALSHSRIGQLDRAEEFYLRALDLIDNKNPMIVELNLQLAKVHRRSNELQQANERMEKAAIAALQHYGKNDRRNAEILRSQAKIALGLKQYNNAVKHLEQALNIMVQANGSVSAKLQILTELGMVWQRSGNYDKAITFYQRALQETKEKLGDSNPSVLHRLNELARAWELKANYTQATNLYEQALHLGNSLYGQGHQVVAQSMRSAARAWEANGDSNKAVSYLEQALVIGRKKFGEQHPNTANQLSDLAGVHYRQGQYQKAAGLYEKAHMIFNLSLGEGSASTKLTQKRLMSARAAAEQEGRK